MVAQSSDLENGFCRCRSRRIAKFKMSRSASDSSLSAALSAKKAADPASVAQHGPCTAAFDNFISQQ